MTLIQSKYRGSCVGCGLPIQKGARMLFDGPGTARHPDCRLPGFEMQWVSQSDAAYKLGISDQDLAGYASAGHIKYSMTSHGLKFSNVEVFRFEMWLRSHR